MVAPPTKTALTLSVLGTLGCIAVIVVAFRVADQPKSKPLPTATTADGGAHD